MPDVVDDQWVKAVVNDGDDAAECTYCGKDLESGETVYDRQVPGTVLWQTACASCHAEGPPDLPEFDPRYR